MKRTLETARFLLAQYQRHYGGSFNEFRRRFEADRIFSLRIFLTARIARHSQESQLPVEFCYHLSVCNRVNICKPDFDKRKERLEVLSIVCAFVNVELQPSPILLAL